MEENKDPVRFTAVSYRVGVDGKAVPRQQTILEQVPGVRCAFEEVSREVFLPEQELEAADAAGMERVGAALSAYLTEHPESPLWTMEGKTQK